MLKVKGLSYYLGHPIYITKLIIGKLVNIYDVILRTQEVETQAQQEANIELPICKKWKLNLIQNMQKHCTQKWRCKKHTILIFNWNNQQEKNQFKAQILEYQQDWKNLEEQAMIK